MCRSFSPLFSTSLLVLLVPLLWPPACAGLSLPSKTLRSHLQLRSIAAPSEPVSSSCLFSSRHPPSPPSLPALCLSPAASLRRSPVSASSRLRGRQEVFLPAFSSLQCPRARAVSGRVRGRNGGESRRDPRRMLFLSSQLVSRTPVYWRGKDRDEDGEGNGRKDGEKHARAWGARPVWAARTVWGRRTRQPAETGKDSVFVGGNTQRLMARNSSGETTQRPFDLLRGPLPQADAISPASPLPFFSREKSSFLHSLGAVSYPGRILPSSTTVSPAFPSSSSSSSSSCSLSSSSSPSSSSSEYFSRLSKASCLVRELSLSPFPPTSWLLSLCPVVLSSPSALHEKFRDLPAGSAASPSLVAVAGRIQSIRNGGMFIDLFSPCDESKLQLFVSLSAAAPSASQHSLSRADSGDHAPAQLLSPSASALSGDRARLGSPTSLLPHSLPAVALLPFLDLGDFLLARGHIRRTQRNELTLDVARVGGLHLVAKRLLPLDLSLSLSRSQALPRVSPGSKSPSSVSFSEGRRAARRGRAPPLDTGTSVLSATDVLQGGELPPASLRAAAARMHATPFSTTAESPWAAGSGCVHAALRSLPSPQRDAQILCSGRLRETLRLRSFIIQTVRDKLLSEAFLEVDTAVLHGMPHARASKEKEGKAENAEQEEQACGRAGEEDGLNGSGCPSQTQQTSAGQNCKEKREDPTAEGRLENAKEKDTPTARLFESHLHALDLPVHLRIAPELALKRLVVSGVSDKVFEIGRCFRNEGISWRHQPEFLSVEAYATFWTYEDMMELTEEIVRLCACRVASLRTRGSRDAESRAPPLSSPVSSPSSSRLSFLSSLFSGTPWGRSKAAEADVRGPRTADDASRAKTREGVDDRESRISWQGHEINLSGPWRRMTMVEALREYTGINFERLSHREALLEVERRLQEGPEREGQEHRSSIPPSPLSLDEKGEDKSKVTSGKKGCGKALPPACLTSVEELMDFTFKEWVESRLTQPTHIVHTPLALSPLAAEKLPEEGKFPVAERFETYVAGMELADGYSELTDPLEQLRRFHSQRRIAKGTDTPLTGPGRTTPETLEAHNHGEARSQEEAKADGLVPNQEFVSALMLGLPPTAGLGIGLDRLVMLLTDSAFIRDVVHMPLRKSVL